LTESGVIIMGLGLALTEETLFDERSGRIMNPSIAEYHVPVHMDVPAIEVIWNDIADPHSPLGAHGIGEIGITGVGAAVANAVYNATGKHIRELSITLDKLLTPDVRNGSEKWGLVGARCCARTSRLPRRGCSRRRSKLLALLFRLAAFVHSWQKSGCGSGRSSL
jgi:hypothetical protein